MAHEAWSGELHGALIGRDICEIGVGQAAGPPPRRSRGRDAHWMRRKHCDPQAVSLAEASAVGLEQMVPFSRVKIAKHDRRSRQVIWSAEERTPADLYRNRHTKIGYRGSRRGGRPIAWHHRGMRLLHGRGRLRRLVNRMVSRGAIDGAAEPAPLRNSNILRYVGPSRGIYDGFWRGGVRPVNKSLHRRSFMDELASRPGQDTSNPSNLLAQQSRVGTVLNLP